MTQFQVLANSIAAKVEVAVFHADVIATISLVFNGEWRRHTLAENVQLGSHNLNVASRHLGVLRLALTHSTLHLNTVLTTKFVSAFCELCVV